VALPIRLLETPWFSTRSYAHLLLAGVFERFPRLRYIVTESGCAWVPSTLENLDRIWERVRTGAVGEFEFGADSMPPHPPSFYAKRNCYYGASAPSRRELSGRHEIGVDHLLWGSDYPHYEGTYPHTRQSFRHTFHDVPEPEVRAILGENAARLYAFDLAKLAPLAERCGPTPVEIAVPLPSEEIPRNTHTNAFR
jgi:predicted TIM-barrel fold metal-dependent hydrolase